MRNVSGILLIRKSIETHFFPNPFCDPEISLVNHQEFFNSFNLVKPGIIVNRVFSALKKGGYIDDKRHLEAMNSGDCYHQTAGTEIINFNRNCSPPNDRRFIEFYLLHEEGHKRQRRRNYLNLLMIVIDVFLSWLIVTSLLPSLTSFEEIIKILAIFVLLICCSVFIISRIVYKKEEYLADIYAAQCLKEMHNETKPSEVVQRALRFIIDVNKTVNPVPKKYVPLYRLYEFINNTYPSPSERVENIHRQLDEKNT